MTVVDFHVETYQVLKRLRGELYRLTFSTEKDFSQSEGSEVMRSLLEIHMLYCMLVYSELIRDSVAIQSWHMVNLEIEHYKSANGMLHVPCAMQLLRMLTRMSSLDGFAHCRALTWHWCNS